MPPHTVAASARSLRFLEHAAHGCYEHSAHGRYEPPFIQHTAAISVSHTVITTQRTDQHTAAISVSHTVITTQRTDQHMAAISVSHTVITTQRTGSAHRLSAPAPGSAH